ncbi:ribosomal protein S6 kinase alpha-5-like isoform X2 [Dendronephthya gigantea]|uniref:ribosomal protein S6 kinase alpha-5-like isoform X2 n=1 Tax=Dendronephthya gigantea TaxID=151771 RepID=UPI001069E904|nr:ribosomal protein S6 kinase alpha-5-like isoform X2 [Dendronephthya gigantea]
MTTNGLLENYFVHHNVKNANLTGHSEKVNIESFDLLKVLGTGAYGKVYLVKKKDGFYKGKLFAMKVLKKATIVQKAKTTEHTMTERQVLESVRSCPFLVTLHWAFQTESKLHLVMDYINGGELFTHLYKRDKFSEDEARIYIAEIVIAIEHLHKLGIIYRDIKLENILLDSKGHVVLTDFGLSKDFSPSDEIKRTYSFCGTIEYMAPELVNGNGNGHDKAVDWWSLGVLLYELLTGASPFTVDGEKNSQSQISKRITTKEPPIPMSFSREAKDFVLRLLAKNPSRRIGSGPTGANEIKKHSFFKKLDWTSVYERKVPAPFVPHINDEMDVSNFSAEFTGMTPHYSPAVVPNVTGQVFRGYSYVAPSIVFNETTTLEDCIRPTYEHRNLSAGIRQASFFEESPFFQNYMVTDEILGDGSFSTCRKCINVRTGLHYAVKVISKRRDRTQEVQSLRLCQDHPNIVNIHEVYQDGLHVYLVMEYLQGGELFDRIRQKKKFTEAEASVLIRKIVSAVAFMHSRGVVHRDIKPENLLFVDHTEDAEIKIIDFGFAKVKTYTMLSGQVPFQRSGSPSNTAANIINRIKMGDFKFEGQQWSAVSQQARDLIQGLLTVNPSERLTISEVQNHEWLSSGRDIPTTPLMTPGILGKGTKRTFVESALNAAYNAFHKATREGFALQAVEQAPLAKRRKQKKDTSEERRSTNCSSEGSSCGDINDNRKCPEELT